MERAGNLDLNHQLCVALYDASRAINGCYRPFLDELGITYSQYAVLLVLWQEHTTTLRDLGHALHLDSGTLSPLLKRLEATGLVVRRRHAADERMLDVSITPAGEALRARAASAQARVEEMTGYDDDSLARLRDELNSLSRRLRSAAHASASV